MKNLVSPSDTDGFMVLNINQDGKKRAYSKSDFSVRFSLESGQPDDLVFLRRSQVARLQLLLQLTLHFHWRVPQFRVCLVLICSAVLSVLWTLSVVGTHVLRHTLASMFRRGATEQARVPHPWVQMQPVHHVVDAGTKMHSVFNNHLHLPKDKNDI